VDHDGVDAWTARLLELRAPRHRLRRLTTGWRRGTT
jgi:hypothetical protein